MKNGKRKTDEFGTFWENEVGQFHRLDGPAVMDPDVMVEWYIDGKRFDDAEKYRVAAGLTEEEMFPLILKYGAPQ